ncbi:MAG: 2-C-methyl-D-erythritol 2,4-cyclodiphosphate synthase [Desulfobacteraceae bacterium]|nr:2-C-methyl-D-erythritol 2,4-cyclodiphosphate synthase [Desulfobacteraceae bacterium]
MDVFGGLRVGFGYDVHRLVAGRPLIIGGVDVPFHKGLMGHSDADVLTHALCDAMLGAACLGDIGRHFPDTDPAYRGISSIALLAMVAGMVADKGLSLGNADITVVAQAPKLAPFIPDMIETLTGALNVVAARVNIKATTTEGMGFAGVGEGMAAYSIVSLVSL